MKNTLLITLWLFMGLSVQAQESKFDVKKTERENVDFTYPLEQGFPVCGFVYQEINSVPKIKESSKNKFQIIEHLPVAADVQGPAFKVYQLNAETEHWYRIQDVYSSLVTKVPSVRISNTRLNQTPRIAIRGDENTIVIVDGIRYDASILNTLNPQDIERIKVSANPAAATYFIANQN